MCKQKPMTAKIRRMIDGGYTNKAIIEKLGCKPRAVYNTRYQVNKERGLGALGAPAPKPVEGIGTPPKKRKPRAKPVETGITSAPKPAINHAQNAWPYDAPALQGAEPYMPTPMIEPKPTLWERIKGWFRG